MPAYLYVCLSLCCLSAYLSDCLNIYLSFPIVCLSKTLFSSPAKAPPTTTPHPDVTSDPLQDVTSTLDLNMTLTSGVTESSVSGELRRNMATIVAGSLVAGIGCVIVAVVVCVRCARWRRERRLSYGE